MARETRNRLVNGIVERELRIAAPRYAKGRLLDIGCGTKPYERLFRRYVTEHVGVDHAETLHDRSRIDLFGTAYEIPVPEASFDTALCTAVLEHLEEPEQALRECFRVLRPGGNAFYIVPFIWHIHEEPRDFYRYTKYGLDYLFGKVGFTDVAVKPLSGYWVTSGQLFAYYVDRLNKGVVRRTHVIDLATTMIQGVAWGLEHLDRPERWTWAYLVTAQKPMP